MIHVCPLAHVAETVFAARASHLVSVLDAADLVETPASILPRNHLRVGCHDIIEPFDGCVLPSEEHVRRIIDFASHWPRTSPIVIHCFAGISRSTATAFIAACLHNPPGREREIARALRRASPTATPNGRIVALADAMLEREGRMIAAIAEIGRGREAFEGAPFRLDVLGIPTPAQTDPRGFR